MRGFPVCPTVLEDELDDHLDVGIGFAELDQETGGLFHPSPPATIRIHPLFHVSQLEPEDPNTFQDREQPPPPPLIVDGQPEYLFEGIIDSKYNRT